MKTQKNIIIGNWKMNLLPSQARPLVKALASASLGLRVSEAWIAPTLLSLPAALEEAAGSALRVGAQNVHWADKGAFTGEVSAGMLLDCGASFALVGHSERRHVFGETPEICARRALAASQRLCVVFCIGETAEERNSGRTASVLEAQLHPVLREMTADRANALLLAYEPVWAIGTGQTATREQAQEVHLFLRGLLTRLFEKNIAESVRILYGGSVKPDNIDDLMAQPDIDGALVGGAALNAESFSRIVHFQ